MLTKSLFVYIIYANINKEEQEILTFNPYYRIALSDGPERIYVYYVKSNTIDRY